MSRRAHVAAFLALCCLACRGDDEPAAPEYAPVETLLLAPVAFEAQLTTTGTVELPDDATLSAEITGTVTAIAAEGAAVSAGQVIARLDARGEEAAVTSGTAAVAEARALVVQAEDAYRRQAPLARDTIISALELQRIQAERAQAAARLAQAQAQLQEARDRLEQTRLRAPFAGVIERAYVRAGEQVSPGAELIRVVRPGRAEIQAGVPGRYAGRIAVGNSASLDLQAYGIGLREGRVAFVGSAVDPRSRTFTVRIDVPDPTGAIKADMVARVRLTHLELPAALVVPLDAIARDERGESVLVAVPAGAAHVAQRRAISTGPRSELGVVVEAGLQAGEEIIIVGGDQVADGEPVAVSRRYPDLASWRAARTATPGGPAP